jgi:hypothetical protein
MIKTTSSMVFCNTPLEPEPDDLERRRRQHIIFKEITYDIDEFRARAADPDKIRLSFLSRPVGDGLVSIQPRLFYPLADSILIWEGPVQTFFTVQDNEIREFEKQMLQFVEGKLGFKPRLGRWEWGC